MPARDNFDIAQWGMAGKWPDGSIGANYFPLGNFDTKVMKYGPFRKALESAAKQATSSHNGEACMFRAIKGMIKNVDLSTYKDWTMSCARGVAHHSGPLPILTKMGVLRKLPSGVRGVRGGCSDVLKVNGRHYQVTQMTCDVKKNLAAWIDSVRQGCCRVQVPRLQKHSMQSPTFVQAWRLIARRGI